MAMSLFRFIEAAGGEIRLDGIATKGVALSRLRECLSMVPQDPVLFGGSLRYNVDPTGRHSDEELITAIEAVGLESWMNRNGGLESDVSEGGSSLSSGERQLVCLARVMLQKPKVLVMDEATSSLDRGTDERIQAILRDKEGPLSEATIVAIAHRLETIVDYDYVCVLDKGKVAEYGPPKELLQKQGGHFRSLFE